jgi:hypothetical protein
MKTRYLIEYSDNNTGQTVMYWSTAKDDKEIALEMKKLLSQYNVEFPFVSVVEVKEELERDKIEVLVADFE